MLHTQAWLLVSLKNDGRKSLSELVQKHVSGLPLFACMDANADPGVCDHCCVFSPGFKTTANTSHLRSFLSDFALCLPSTGSAHHGEHETWTSPDGTFQNCIDHVVVPQALVECCSFSSLIPDFDLGTSCTDHVAVALQLDWQASDAPAQPMHHTHIMKYNRNTLSKAHVQDALRSFRPAAWHADVETYTTQLIQHLGQDLRKQCPPGNAKPKKEHIDEQVWHLRAEKLRCRKGLKELEQIRRRELLCLAFKALRSSEGLTEYGHHFLNYDIWLQCVRVRLYVNFSLLARKMRHHLRTAKQKHIEATFASMPDNASAGTILHEIKKIVGPTNLKKIQSQPLPHVLKSDDTPCATPQEAVDTWADFFHHMEGGFRTTMQQQREDWLDHLRQLRSDGFDFSLLDLPCLTLLEAAFRRVNPNKATGPDGIDAALCHHCPTLFAKKTFPLLIRTVLHGEEGLIFKGGQLQALWKNKGPRNRCSSFRSILISSHVGKSIHRCLRTHSADLFEHYLQKQQLGGKRGVPVTLGVQQARSFLRSRLAAGRCVGMLFLDLCEAFYRIVRQLSIGGPIPDEVIAKMGHRLGLTPDILHELYQHLHEEPAITRAGLPLWQQKVIQSVHTDTHFHVSGQQDVCQTYLGTRPGDCYADIVFSFLWARLLRSLECDLHARGFLDCVPHAEGFCIETPSTPESPEQSPYLGPTWMDDTCLCLAASSPEEIVRISSQAASLLLHKCECFAMTPNLSAGKSELMLVFQGRGARKARLQYFGPDAAPGLPIVTDGGVKTLAIVTSYTHLGCTIHHKEDVRREVRRRFALAHTAFNMHRRLLFQNKSLEMAKRVELFRTLILSKLLYGAESWVLHEAKMRHYIKRLIRGSSDHCSSV